MNTPIAKMLMETFDLTETEKEFIQKFDKPITPQEEYEASVILTNLYTAKVHEQAARQASENAVLNRKAAEESEKSSRVITKLTWVLMCAAVVQAAAAVAVIIFQK